MNNTFKKYIKNNKLNIGLITLFIVLFVIFANMFTTYWSKFDNGTVPGGQPLQTVVPEGWIGIYSYEDLNNMRNNLSGNYILMTKLDLLKFTKDKFGWIPVGRAEFPFTGQFDGNDMPIFNLRVASPTIEYTGLFGYTNGATIKNVRLVNANIEGNCYNGSLAGFLKKSTISNCSATGMVKGYSFTGGLIGHCYLSSSITDSCFSGNVSGENNYTGGLVGLNFKESSIACCSSSGSVTGQGYYTGGLVGSNKVGSQINDSFSDSIVTGNSCVGGFVGAVDQSTTANSYAQGIVTGTDHVGGFVGHNHASNIISSYWNMDASGQTESMGGLSKNTSEMMSQKTFEGWDFNSIWSISEGASFPYLKQ